MESKKSVKAYLDSKGRYFVEIGFIFSLTVMLLILGCMLYFSKHETYSMLPFELEMPKTIGMNEENMQNIVQQQQSAPAEEVTVPLTSFLNIVANNVMVSENIAIDTVKMKSGSMENRSSGNGSGTNTESDVGDELPFAIVEEPPTFPGGMEALLKFLGDKMKYPSVAKHSGISGTVTISFLVTQDGSISNVKVIRGIGGGCNEEAIRVVSMMPKWTPGKQRGKAVITNCQIPIVFFLPAN